MMDSRKSKLELTWMGKEDRARLETRILLENPALSYHAAHRVGERDQFDNYLIYGDNLLALKALESQFTGRVKCIYIDPPYNTGSAFTHYDDGLEHSLWLTMMRDRLEILRLLLAEDGVIFVSIDDTEAAYLKVLMDEVFMRKNFCGQFIWEKKKKPSFLNGSMGIVTEYILAYAKRRELSPAFIGGTTTAGKKYPLNNAGNGVKTLTFPAGKVVFRCNDIVFEPQDMSEGNIITRLLDTVIVKDGRNVDAFRLEGEWRYSQSRLDEIIEADEQIIISKSPFRPNHLKAGGEPKKLKNLLSIAHYQMSTYEDATEESRALFGEANAFDYPKPEKLIATLIESVTEEGDLILDSFAGSGTTGAVAHKMRRRFILAELGDHVHTHIIPRLRKVIDGEDAGGITSAVNWQGGGGFRYFRLAPTLLVKDKYGNYVINREYNAEMLAEAMCRHQGFTYAPSDTVYWQHGQSSETDFIYVTTQTLTRDQLVALSDEVGANRTLLICAAAFRANADGFQNLTLRKISSSVLHQYERGRDDYSLRIAQLPAAPAPEDDALAPANPAQAIGKPKRKRRDSAHTVTAG